MTARIVRLGTPRLRGEGLRIGTVRHPPRGVPKGRHASGNWYDVWLPILAPGAATVKLGRAVNLGRWRVVEGCMREATSAPVGCRYGASGSHGGERRCNNPA